MNKFEKAIEKIEEELQKIKEIEEVYVYGSVARGDYSLKHSDLDVFIVLNLKKESKKIERKINSVLDKIRIRCFVKIQAEYQYKEIKSEDKTLIYTVINEGKLIFSKNDLIKKNMKIGLKVYKLYEFTTKGKEQLVKTKLTQTLHGRNGQKGLIDGDNIIGVGRGGLLVKKEKEQYIQNTFKQLSVPYKIKGTFFGY